MLNGRKIAILVAEGFEQVEMTEPRKALEQAGAETEIVSPAQGEVQGWNHFDKADRFHVDVALDEADAGHYDALLLPGGVANPDQLRTQPKAVQFVKQIGKEDVAAPASLLDGLNEEAGCQAGLAATRAAQPDDILFFTQEGHRVVECQDLLLAELGLALEGKGIHHPFLRDLGQFEALLEGRIAFELVFLLDHAGEQAGVGEIGLGGGL